MATTRWDAVGIGLAVRDITVEVDRYPAPDEKVPARRTVESGGGPVPTALVAMARFGRRTALSAVIGDDSVGRFIRRGLDDEQVDTSCVVVHPGFESPTSVIVIESGRRTILEAPRSSSGLPLSWKDVERLPLDACHALLVDARLIEVQLRAAARVRDAGGVVLLDCGHPRPGVDELLAHSDIAIFSHTFPVTRYGDDVDTEIFLTDVLARLPSSGPRIAGVTLGDEGSAFVSPDVAYREYPAHPVQALDTTGAGDVFHGAFLHAYLQTSSVEAAARFANVTAARKCEGMTGRAPLPPESELWELSET